MKLKKIENEGEMGKVGGVSKSVFHSYNSNAMLFFRSKGKNERRVVTALRRVRHGTEFHFSGSYEAHSHEFRLEKTVQCF